MKKNTPIVKSLNNSKINDSSPDNGFLTLFTATCEANHQWFYHSSDKPVLTLKRSGETGFEKRHLVLQNNKKLVLFTNTKDNPVLNNSIFYDWDDF